MTLTLRTATCTCGQVAFEARGEPIVSAVCYCSDCQDAGQNIARDFPGATPCNADGGTDYSTFRQDRWTCLRGEEHLVPVKLRPKSPTTRYVATCCNSAVYLTNAMGYWVSTYRNRYVSDLPPLEWRHKLAKRRSNLPLPDNIPTYQGFPPRIFARLIWYGLAKLLRR